jgi:simple sugar transport system permease protein
MSRRFTQIISRMIPPILAVAICLCAALLLLSSLGFGRQPGDGFMRGVQHIAHVVRVRSLLPGRNYRFWIQTLLAATPIVLTGLAIAIAFRASVLNIGAEGQFVVGAIAGTAVGLSCHAPPLLVLAASLMAGAVAGALLAGIAALLHRYRAVPVVLSTLLLNFVAAVLLKSLLQGPLHERGDQLQSEQLPEAARLPRVFLHGLPTQLHAGLFIAIACALLISFLLRYTKFGIQLPLASPVFASDSSPLPPSA